MGILYTAPYSYRGTDRVDITRQGCERLLAAGLEAPGEILAPSNKILWPAKRGLQRATSEEGKRNIFVSFAGEYRTEMLRSYSHHRNAWLSLAARHELTLVCFCRDRALCHRSLAAEYLQKISMGWIELAGERPDRRRRPAGHSSASSRSTPKRIPRCQEGRCLEPYVAICDYPIVRRGQMAICDKRLCASHRHPVGGHIDRDYCEEHHAMVGLPQPGRGST